MFGSAIHKALERYYSDIMNNLAPTRLDLLQVLFSEHLRAGIADCTLPIIYKTDTPDQEQALEMGHTMLEQVYAKLAPAPGIIVAGVEVTLAAALVNTWNHPIDMMLTGIVDLVLLDQNMHPIVIDFKTARQSKAQSAADEDIQMSVYAYLMTENNYADPQQPLDCRFHILRKLKTPKLETVTTKRTQAHRSRLIKLINAVLSGIENQVFIPNKGWLSSDCADGDAYKNW